MVALWGEHISSGVEKLRGFELSAHPRRACPSAGSPVLLREEEVREIFILSLDLGQFLCRVRLKASEERRVTF